MAPILSSVLVGSGVPSTCQWCGSLPCARQRKTASHMAAMLSPCLDATSARHMQPSPVTTAKRGGACIHACMHACMQIMCLMMTHSMSTMVSSGLLLAALLLAALLAAALLIAASACLQTKYLLHTCRHCKCAAATAQHASSRCGCSSPMVSDNEANRVRPTSLCSALPLWLHWCRKPSSSGHWPAGTVCLATTPTTSATDVRTTCTVSETITCRRHVLAASRTCSRVQKRRWGHATQGQIVCNTVY